MTKKEAVASFREWLDEARRDNPNLLRDKPALREAWNNYTDGLCKDRQITPRQYDTWIGPF